MKKNLFRNALVILTSLGLLGFFIQRKQPEYKEVEIDGRNYKLEVAKTTAKRMKGLMGREKLEKNEGMLFVFPNEGRHSFWMYNTLIPLDMIWLNGNWEIVHVERDVPPCRETNPLKCPSYEPGAPAKYVVELPANSIL